MRQIAEKFKPGMAWENRGEIWELDHIIPRSRARTTEELEHLCHIDNLEPIEALQNSRKGNRLEPARREFYKSFCVVRGMFDFLELLLSDLDEQTRAEESWQAYLDKRRFPPAK